jgi:hypothetical protein
MTVPARWFACQEDIATTATLVLSASIVLFLGWCIAFLFPQPVKLDVGGFISPILETLWTGQTTYPAHGVDHAHTMVIHPPVHYRTAGLLMRAGFGLFQALGTIAFAGLVVGVAAVLTGPFKATVKIAFLFALLIPNFLLIDLDAIRPELQMALVLVAGLVLLEGGRLRKWRPLELAIGAFLVCYASSLHYFAWPGAAGVAVYWVWVLFTGVGKARWLAFGALALGSAIYVVPYASLFAWPHRADINALVSALRALDFPLDQSTITPFQYHQEAYAASPGYMGAAFDPNSPWRNILSPFFYYRVPAAFVAVPILLLHPQTRGIALASLPFLLPLLYLVNHKSLPYFRVELTLLCAALIIAVLEPATAFLRRLTSYAAQGFFLLSVIAFGLMAIFDDRVLAGLRGGRFVDEIAVQRTVAHQMVSSGATVGGASIVLWYTSGGHQYRSVTADIVYPADISGLDIGSYFSDFDAIAEGGLGSWITYNKQGKVLSSFYIEGDLSLVGVYFGRPVRGSQNDFFLASRKLAPVSAYYWYRDNFFQFVPDQNGAQVLAALVVPSVQFSTENNLLGRSLASFQLLLPAQSKERLVFTVLPDDNAFEALKAGCGGCQLRDVIKGRSVRLQPDRIAAAVDYPAERVRVHYSREEALASQVDEIAGASQIVADLMPEMPVRDRTRAGTTVAARDPVVQVPLFRSKPVSVMASGLYKVDLSLDVLSGAVLVIAYSPTSGRHYAQLYRRHGYPPGIESFVVGPMNDPDLAIQILSNNQKASWSVATVGPATITPVQIRARYQQAPH